VADATNIPVQPTDSSTPSSPFKSGAGFLATSTGKLVVGGTALLVLLVIVGASATLLTSGCSASMFKSGGVKVTSAPGQSPGTTVVVAEAVPVANPPAKPLTSSFTFRNVFAPSVKPPIRWIPEPTVVTESSDSDTPSNSTSPTVAPVTTLSLDAIVTEGDAHKGRFKWNGVSYTAGKGETIDGSPWKVLDVLPASCLMLYGDVQETIVVGQTITK
jgi:hypothetical protein